jgi:hypothetical protein
MHSKSYVYATYRDGYKRHIRVWWGPPLVDREQRAESRKAREKRRKREGKYTIKITKKARVSGSGDYTEGITRRVRVK